jgi:hypothetical protein
VSASLSSYNSFRLDQRGCAPQASYLQDATLSSDRSRNTVCGAHDGNGNALATSYFNSYVAVSTTEGAPQRRNGRMSAPAAPGFGISPRMDVVGQPAFSVKR